MKRIKRDLEYGFIKLFILVNDTTYIKTEGDKIIGLYNNKTEKTYFFKYNRLVVNG